MLPPVFGVLFDGIAYGMLLFVLSVGLSVTLGLMNFVNLAHGAFGMLGGDVALTVTLSILGLPFLLAPLPAAFIAAAVVGIACERTLFRRLYRAGELNQVLFTIGLVFVATAIATFVFGTGPAAVESPDFLRGGVDFWGSGLANTGCSCRRGDRGDGLHPRPRIHPLRGEGARGRGQSAHGTRSWHRCRPHVRRDLRARLRPGRPRWRAGHRDRRPRSEL